MLNYAIVMFEQAKKEEERLVVIVTARELDDAVYFAVNRYDQSKYSFLIIPSEDENDLINQYGMPEYVAFTAE